MDLKYIYKGIRLLGLKKKGKNLRDLELIKEFLVLA